MGAFRSSREVLLDGAALPLRFGNREDVLSLDGQIGTLQEIEKMPDHAALFLDSAELKGFLDSVSSGDQPSAAPAIPLGSEILVNSATAGNQNESRMIALTGGGFVVVWVDASLGVGGATGDTTGVAVKAQLFDASGAKVGSEILVNSATAGAQNNARVTALTGGGFAVTWVDASAGVGGAGGDSSGTAIKAQIFSSTGATVGSELLVNTTIAGSQNAQQVTALPTGGFVVAWSDSFSSIKTQMFDSNGTKVGAEQVASNPLAGATQVPQITTLTNGGYVVTWFEVRSSGGGDNDSFRVSAQIFDSAGAKVGSDILVNTATASSQYDPAVTALGSGRFLITWTDFSLGVGGASGDASQAAVKGQIFDATGAKVGSELLINTATSGIQQFSRITTLNNGGFVVTWTDESAGVGGATGDNSGIAIKAQVYDANGVAVGGEILVNTQISGNQDAQKIIALSDGGFAVIWNDASNAIRMQVFDAAGVKTGGELLVNTAVGSHFNAQFVALAGGGIAASWTSFFTSGGAPGDSSGSAIRAQVFTHAPPNAPPTGLDGSINFYEDATLFLNDPVYFGYSDPEGDAFGGVWIDSTAGNGSWTLNGAALVGPVFVTAAQVTGGQLRFTPAPDVSGNNYASFTFRVTDSAGGVDPVANMRALNIISVNDRPVADLNGALPGVDTTVAYTEGGLTITPLQNIVLSDVDSPSLTGATVTIASGFVAGDLMRLSDGTSGVTASGITFNYNPATGVMTLSGSASAADYQAALATLYFKTNADDPGTARTITVTATDGTDTSIIANLNLTITPTNDAPVNSVPGGQFGTEGGAILFGAINGNAITISDPDAGSSMVRVKLSVDHGTLSLLSSAGVTVTGDGTSLMRITGTVSAINAALDGLLYTGEPGYTGSANLFINTNDFGNNGSGGQLTDSDSVAVTWEANIQEPIGKASADQPPSNIASAFVPVDGSGENLESVDGTALLAVRGYLQNLDSMCLF